MTLPAIVFAVVSVSLIVFASLVAIQATVDMPTHAQSVRRLRKRNAMRERRLEERRRHRRAVRRIRRSN
jgi:hypothetical protein